MSPSKRAGFTRAVRACAKLAEHIYEVELGEVSVAYVMIGGDAAIATNKTRTTPYIIELNAVACMKYPEIVRAEIIPHEVAHLVCFADPRFGDYHDRRWRAVCRSLGGTGETWHEMKLL